MSEDDDYIVAGLAGLCSTVYRAFQNTHTANMSRRRIASRIKPESANQPATDRPGGRFVIAFGVLRESRARHTSRGR